MGWTKSDETTKSYLQTADTPKNYTENIATDEITSYTDTHRMSIGEVAEKDSFYKRVADAWVKQTGTITSVWKLGSILKFVNESIDWVLQEDAILDTYMAFIPCPDYDVIGTSGTSYYPPTKPTAPAIPAIPSVVADGTPPTVPTAPDPPYPVPMPTLRGEPTFANPPPDPVEDGTPPTATDVILGFLNGNSPSGSEPFDVLSDFVDNAMETNVKNYYYSGSGTPSSPSSYVSVDAVDANYACIKQTMQSDSSEHWWVLAGYEGEHTNLGFEVPCWNAKYYSSLSAAQAYFDLWEAYLIQHALYLAYLAEYAIWEAAYAVAYAAYLLDHAVWVEEYDYYHDVTWPAWQAYVIAYDAWLAGYDAAYAQYLIDIDTYNTDLAAYNAQHTLYLAYLVVKAAYDIEKAAYDILKAAYDILKSAYDSDLSTYNSTWGLTSSAYVNRVANNDSYWVQAIYTVLTTTYSNVEIFWKRQVDGTIITTAWLIDGEGSLDLVVQWHSATDYSDVVLTDKYAFGNLVGVATYLTWHEDDRDRDTSLEDEELPI